MRQRRPRIEFAATWERGEADLYVMDLGIHVEEPEGWLGIKVGRSKNIRQRLWQHQYEQGYPHKLRRAFEGEGGGEKSVLEALRRSPYAMQMRYLGGGYERFIVHPKVVACFDAAQDATDALRSILVLHSRSEVRGA